MTTRLILIACVVAGVLFCWWGITRLFNRWADAEQRAERERLNRIMQAGAPRAAGLRGDVRRIG
jgi:hypothetical protein